MALLIGAGAAVNLVDRRGNTPLHKATIHQQTHLIPTLMKAGADIHTQNMDRLSPIQCALGRGRKELAEFMQQSSDSTLACC